MVTEKTLHNLPKTPGVYIFRDKKGTPLYIGKSVDIRARVNSYFQDPQLPPRTQQLVSLTENIETIQTESEIEALLLEAEIIRTLKPRFNSQLKDDKHYKYIQITDSIKKSRKIDHPSGAYPTIKIARKPDDPQSIYFGPFPAGGTVNSVIKTLRRIFGWCKYSSLSQQGREKRPCFYFHLNQCPGVCAGKITPKEYLEHIDNLIRFLQGNKKKVLLEYKQKMQSASKRENYETAAHFRDLIEKLSYITQQFKDPSTYLKSPVLQDEMHFFALKQLREIIGSVRTDWAPFLRELIRIEGYDISNTQGSEPTASMIVFTNALPNSANYRRFKIAADPQPNDTKMMQEVLMRRFKRFSAEKLSPAEDTSEDESFSQIPQLIIVDGGKGQVRAALKVLHNYALDIPLIGIAKREEQLIIPHLPGDDVLYTTKKLPLDSPAIQLVQHIRDEAHRFAKKYHKLLRTKALITKN